MFFPSNVKDNSKSQVNAFGKYFLNAFYFNCHIKKKNVEKCKLYIR
jgi:hypothetical protein